MSSPNELARFGDQLVCAFCKDDYAQKLREGVGTAVALDFEYVGFWPRVAASIIDAIILFVIQFLFQMALAPLLSFKDLAAIGLALALNLLSMAMGACYEVFLIHRYGATLGKMALGVKVVRPDGSLISVGRAFGRYFAKMLSAIILCIGYLMVAFDSESRGLHDMICDTRVIKAR
jgi:uncharacterized RDD family membrane protein YckC